MYREIKCEMSLLSTGCMNLRVLDKRVSLKKAKGPNKRILIKSKRNFQESSVSPPVQQIVSVRDSAGSAAAVVSVGTSVEESEKEEVQEGVLGVL